VMAGGGGEENELSLKYTSTWVVAVVCSIIVLISLLVERFFHFTGKYLKKKNQIPLYEALQKVKEELMLLGFISFLLTVFQNWIVKFCVSPNLTNHLLPCKYKEDHDPKIPRPVVIESDYCGKQ
ncbi:Mlo-like protein, partial [Thalictrum thalictroides]